MDDEGDQITAVYKKALKLKDLLLSCIPSSSRNADNLTAIRLHCRTNKVSCVRRITLKALLGVIFMLQLINKLRILISQMIYSLTLKKK